jgi:transcriptional regulator with XRE-family HTH domain
MTESAAHDLVSVGGRLAELRGKANQPLRALAFGVHKNTYARWERGDAEMPASALAVLVGEGWNANWVLTGTGPRRLDTPESLAGPTSHAVSGESLSIAVELADEALKGLWLPRNRYYDLVALIYDGLTQGLPYAEIIDFARPAATKLAKERDDDGRTEMGGGGSGDPAGREAGGYG